MTDVLMSKVTSTLIVVVAVVAAAVALPISLGSSELHLLQTSPEYFV